VRFILAAVAFVASVVALVFGGIQFVAASQASTVTADGTSDSGAPVMVINDDVLSSRAGLQDILITGEGEINVVIGRTNDVMAWVGDAKHDMVTLDEDANHSREHIGLTFTESGSEDTVPSPIGNDLWYEEHEGEGEVRLSTTVAPGYSILITSDGESPAPSTVSVTWPLGGYAPLSGPLLVIGGVLFVLFLALLWWAIAHRRRMKRRAASAARKRRVAGTPAEAAEHESLEWTPVPWDGDAEAAAEERAAEAAAGTPAAVDEDAPIDFPADEPGVEEPRIDEPVAEESVVEEPVATEPAVEESVFAEPAAEKPVTAEPVVEEPVVEEPVVEEPVVEEPAAEEPAVEEPTAEEPAVEEPAPEPEQPAAAPADDDSMWKRPRGRNRSKAPKRSFFVASTAMVVGLTLAGCAPQYWPAEWTDVDLQPTGTATSTVDAAILDEGANPPALNLEQIQSVITEAGELAVEADKAHDSSILEPRFEGDALAERIALYRGQKADGELPAPAAFPTGDIVYALPESTDEFPRTIFAVVNASPDSPDAPFGVMLVQDTARDNFKVSSLVQLASNVTLPEAAPTNVGAASIRDLPGDLVIAPGDLANAYADVIAQGDASPHADLFSTDNDSLRAEVNQAYRDEQTEALDPEVTNVDFAYAGSDSSPLGMVALDDGAIIAVSITETETVSAANDRARITVSGATAALSGIETTEYGFERTYTDQLLFYVPSAETGGQVQFLGVSQALTSASELSE
jgi:hypothetical protein